MKVYKTGQQAKLKIKKGIDEVANAVRLTLGPSGSNSIIGRPFMSPLITNDGITIAKEMQLEDELENLGAEIVKEALRSANDISGDGTTTTTVLLQAIMDEGFKRLDPNSLVKKQSAMSVRKEIQEACAVIVEELKKTAKPIKSIEDITKVATIAVESEKIGKLIASMFKELGKDALITVQDGFNNEIQTETVLGIDVEAGLPSQYFSNNDKGEFTEDSPFVLVTNHPINTPVDIMPAVELSINSGKKSLIVLSEYFDKNLIKIFLDNKLNNQFTVIPVTTPTTSKSETLEDVAIAIGARFINKEVDKIADLKKEDFGTCNKIIISSGKTLFIGIKGNTKDRVKKLKQEEKEAESLFDKEKLKKRINKLSGGIGIIRVDAESQTEKEYLKLKIEDAINATRCALEEGVVKGGGLALKEISDRVEKNILSEAITKPYKQIQENSGGFLEITEDVIDPVKVTRTSLEKACSVAAMVLTTEIAIADKKEEEKDFKAE